MEAASTTTQQTQTPVLKQKVWKRMPLKVKLIILLILAGVLSFIAIIGIILLFLLGDGVKQKPIAPGGTGTARVSEDVLRWESTVRKYAEQNNIPTLVPFLLSLIQQESSGTMVDVMQASESKCGYIGCITDPEESISYGVARFARLYQAAGGYLYIAAQSYNMGDGFIPHSQAMGTNPNDLASVEEAAKAYAKKYATQTFCQPAYRHGYCYGDIHYISNILRYYTTVVVDGKGSGKANELAQQIIAMAAQYEGQPYTFGGRTPPLFDCSGLVEWVYGQFGISITGTAADQYNKTVPVENPAPGDLVFFENTYKPGISHIGIYIGNNQMFNAGGTHLHYADLNNKYWKEHFAGFRRVP